MDKVNGSNSQSMTMLDRNRSRGHYSSVDGALKAHRQRRMERHSRVEQRLNMVKGMQNRFFPQPQAQPQSATIQDRFQVSSVNNQAIAAQQIPMANTPEMAMEPEVLNLNPIEMDEIYNEASLGSIADNAMGIVQKEIANPDEGPMDEVPKGSYVDYNV